jgi:heme/copper-type cytochrome/quinol oxidase subunit 3
MPHDTHGGISNPVLGMLLFIVSEVMFFAGLFAAYFSPSVRAPPVAADQPGDAEAFLCRSWRSSRERRHVLLVRD